ncbi:MAG: 50S ribosomal protein L32 [Chlorobi bacterium]|nr:50S ribosomal protein L32 [Chlorobiota bacterium]
MAVPKRRHSRSRTRKRRSENMKIKAPQYNRCPNCGEPVLPHRVCMSCGYYRGTIVIEIGKEA